MSYTSQAYVYTDASSGTGYGRIVCNNAVMAPNMLSASGSLYSVSTGKRIAYSGPAYNQSTMQIGHAYINGAYASLAKGTVVYSHGSGAFYQNGYWNDPAAPPSGTQTVG